MLAAASNLVKTLGMSYPLYIVDVFAESKYAGNQLAVVVHDGDLTGDLMQRIARETNFSETTFVQRSQRADGAWSVRIFTPAEELPFAGHPTLGTAWVLRHCIDPTRPNEIRLDLPVGLTPVRFAADERGELGWLMAPAPRFGRTFPAAPVAEILGLSVDDLDPELPVVEMSVGPSFVFVPLVDVGALACARFRGERYEAASELGVPPSQFLFCRSADGESEYRARMFATPMGIVEDPATGSANACLAAYLLRYVQPEAPYLGARVAQGIEMGRPSLLHLAARPQGETSHIEVGGRVVLTVRGELV